MFGTIPTIEEVRQMAVKPNQKLSDKRRELLGSGFLPTETKMVTNRQMNEDWTKDGVTVTVSILFADNGAVLSVVW